MLEDFADFDLVDEDNSRAREDRMRIAFEKSKQSYSQEQVFTEPQWYDPPEIPPPTKIHIRNIDYSLNNLYLKREYSKALPLALAQLEEERDLGDGRENQLVDIAIRCALKLGDNQLAGMLADKTIHKWSSNVALAAISAEAYLASARARDALSAILLAITLRGRLRPYILILYRAFQALAYEQPELNGFKAILSIIKPYAHLQTSADSEALPVADEDEATIWLEECGVTGVDQERLYAQLCHKPIAEKESAEGRSVKTL